MSEKTVDCGHCFKPMTYKEAITAAHRRTNAGFHAIERKALFGDEGPSFCKRCGAIARKFWFGAGWCDHHYGIELAKPKDEQGKEGVVSEITISPDEAKRVLDEAKRKVHEDEKLLSSEARLITNGPHLNDSEGYMKMSDKVFKGNPNLRPLLGGHQQILAVAYRELQNNAESAFKHMLVDLGWTPPGKTPDIAKHEAANHRANLNEEVKHLRSKLEGIKEALE